MCFLTLYKLAYSAERLLAQEDNWSARGSGCPGLMLVKGQFSKDFSLQATGIPITWDNYRNVLAPHPHPSDSPQIP